MSDNNIIERLKYAARESLQARNGSDIFQSALSRIEQLERELADVTDERDGLKKVLEWCNNVMQIILENQGERTQAFFECIELRAELAELKAARDEIMPLFEKWRKLTEEGDALFNVPRQRTNARAKYFQAHGAAVKAMKVIEQRKACAHSRQGSG